MIEQKKFATIAVQSYEPEIKSGAGVVPGINLATTFKQKSPGCHYGYEYSRSGNPTRQVLEATIAKLEKAAFGLAFSSGSATTATIVNLLSSGDHVLSVNDVYGGTNRYFNKVASKMGIQSTFIDMSDPTQFGKMLKENTKMVWIETPTNPTLKLVDIQEVCKAVHTKDKKIIIVVDNTFQSPYLQNPILLGADIVMHSATKYINGHCDVVMGLAATNNKELFERLQFLQNAIGAVPSPFDCYLVHRGIKTLHLRMERHCENAMKIALFLESKSDKILKIYYPGLTSHPQHELAKKQQKLFGGMISFTMKGTADTTNKFLSALKIFTLAESLGGVESLIEVPAVMTHAALKPEERAELGILDTFVRLSVGIEDADDLIADLSQALDEAQ